MGNREIDLLQTFCIWEEDQDMKGVGGRKEKNSYKNKRIRCAIYMYQLLMRNVVTMYYQ